MDMGNLSITDADLLDAVDFEKISALKQLKVVYTRFRRLQKNNLFDSLAEKNSWINKHAGMVKEIPFNLLVPDKNL